LKKFKLKAKLLGSLLGLSFLSLSSSSVYANPVNIAGLTDVVQQAVGYLEVYKNNISIGIQEPSFDPQPLIDLFQKFLNQTMPEIKNDMGDAAQSLSTIADFFGSLSQYSYHLGLLAGAIAVFYFINKIVDACVLHKIVGKRLDRIEKVVKEGRDELAEDVHSKIERGKNSIREEMNSKMDKAGSCFVRAVNKLKAPKTPESATHEEAVIIEMPSQDLVIN
jgi:hypothetical protein